MKKEDLIEYNNKQIIKMNNILINQNARKNVIVQKLFYCVVANTHILENNKIVLSKSYIRDCLELPKDKNSANIVRNGLQELMKNSLLTFEKNDGFIDGFLIPKIESSRNHFTIHICEDFVPLFIEYSKGYTQMLLKDTMQFKTRHSMMLYQQLMFLHKYSSSGIQFTTEQLFKIFSLDPLDYHKPNGAFDRYNFEKRVIEPSIKEINKSNCILGLKYSKTYESHNKRLVEYYVFEYIYLGPNYMDRQTPPTKISNSELIEIVNTPWVK